MSNMALQLWFFSCFFLTLGHALNCSVTLDNGRASYSSSGLPQVSAGDWDYTWANSTGHVIARNKGKNLGLVVLKNTNTILITSEFIEGVSYTGTIVSEGERLTAPCLIHTENAQSWKDKEVSSYPFLGGAIAAMVVFFILLVLLLVFLHYKFRDKIPSRCGCIYTAVENADPDVEAGNG